MYPWCALTHTGGVFISQSALLEWICWRFFLFFFSSFFFITNKTMIHLYTHLSQVLCQAGHLIILLSCYSIQGVTNSLCPFQWVKTSGHELQIGELFNKRVDVFLLFLIRLVNGRRFDSLLHLSPVEVSDCTSGLFSNSSLGSLWRKIRQLPRLIMLFHPPLHPTPFLFPHLLPLSAFYD